MKQRYNPPQLAAEPVSKACVGVNTRDLGAQMGIDSVNHRIMQNSAN